MTVNNKVIVVTGGGDGLGRELVLQLLRKGASVAAVDIREKALEATVELAGSYGDNLSTHVIDVTDKQAVEQLPNQVRERWGAIDGLINNAGIIQPFIPVKDLDWNTISHVFQVNYFGTLYMTKAFLPLLLDRAEAHIINVSSMGGFFPVPGQTIYGASKAAVKLLTEGLYTELLNSKVKVTLVLPGGMGTDIMKNSGVEMNPEMAQMQGSVKVITPQRAAEIVIKSIEKDRYRVLVGSDAKLMYFLYRLAPSIATRIFAKYMGSKLMGGDK